MVPVSGPYEAGAESAPTGMCLWHVLKQGPRHLGAHADDEILCKIDTIAPHIPVLPRDIPFILNIPHCCFILGVVLITLKILFIQRPASRRESVFPPVGRCAELLHKWLEIIIFQSTDKISFWRHVNLGMKIRSKSRSI